MKKIVFLSVIVLILGIIFFRIPIMKSIYPIKDSEYVEKYSEEYEVDKYLIYATIKAESNFNKNANSSKSAKGLMQLLYSTAIEIANELGIEVNEESILDPDTNIKLGTKYISKMLQKYKNIGLALAAYNAGSSKVDSWIKDGTIKSDGSDIENIPFKETNNYVRKIIKDYKIYTDLYK